MLLDAKEGCKGFSHEENGHSESRIGETKGYFTVSEVWIEIPCNTQKVLHECNSFFPLTTS